jgi:hypothetical protein
MTQLSRGGTLKRAPGKPDPKRTWQAQSVIDNLSNAGTLAGVACILQFV